MFRRDPERDGRVFFVLNNIKVFSYPLAVRYGLQINKRGQETWFTPTISHAGASCEAATSWRCSAIYPLQQTNIF